jgi:ABC-2 type transport system permease protein
MKRFFRSRSRIFGVIGQPLLYLLALGYGLGSVFKAAGQGNYLQFLVPGIIAQTILFSGVFWGIQIIFDKQFGFLKETLVAPVSRLQIMAGGALGGATIAFVQGVLVFVIALALGFRPHDWTLVPVGFLLMLVLSITLACFGSAIASVVNDFQGFQAINNFLIFPMYFLSGALYPLTGIPTLLKVVSSIDPLTYAIDGLRAAFINQHHFSIAVDVVALGLTGIAAIIWAVYSFERLEA